MIAKKILLPLRTAFRKVPPLVLIVFVLSNVLWSLIFYNYFFEFFPTVVDGELYEASSVWIYSVNKLGFVTVVVVVCAAVAYSFSRINWSDLDVAGLRLLVGLIAGLLAVKFGLYDYNYFYDQYHVPDRALLFLFWALLVWNPAFLGLFLLQFSLVIAQFYYPLQWGYIHFIHLPFFFLVLTFSYLPVKAYFRCESRVFVVVTLAFVGVNFVDSGVFKLLNGTYPWSWIVNQQLEYMYGLKEFLGWSHGVFGVPGDFSRFLSWTSVLWTTGGLSVELAGILLGWSLGVTVVLLFSYAIFHVLNVIVGGVIFWPWMILEAGLALVAYRWHHTSEDGGLSRGIYPVIVLLIVVGVLFPVFKTNPIGFYDTKYNYRLDMVAVGTKGERQRLSPSEFSPYDFHFQVSPFLLKYLVNQKILPVQTTDEKSALLVNERVSTPDDFDDITAEFGVNYYHSEWAGDFDRFVERFMCYKNKAGNGGILFSVSTYMDYFVGSKSPTGLPGTEIRAVEVILVEAVFHEGENRVVNRERIRRVNRSACR